MKARGSTQSDEYARYLEGRHQGWKRWVDVQWPYRRHLRSLSLGSTLDIGCGTGRNLENLKGTGRIVGVDHNASSVLIARKQGFNAFTVDEFESSGQDSPNSFDTLLFAHVLEHLEPARQAELLRDYLPYLKPRGRLVIITPQEAGFRSDPTHVTWSDFDRIDALLRELGLAGQQHYSFPFPRWVGRIFKYNEFVTVAAVPNLRPRP